MNEHVPVGSTVNIRIFLFNRATALAGRSVSVSIERVSDGKFWDGADFDPGSYTGVAMTEKSGNVHYEGVYEYNFAIPRQYDEAPFGALGVGDYAGVGERQRGVCPPDPRL